MAADSNVRFVYRLGSATDDALTPRQKDLAGDSGVTPGLSVELNPPPGQKAQKLDLMLLPGSGLAFVPDNVMTGGREDHGVIVPVSDVGDPVHALLIEWAASRGTGVRHRYTQAILSAIIDTVRSAR